MGIYIDRTMMNVMEYEGSDIGALCDVVMMTTDVHIRHGATMEGGIGTCIGTETGREGGGWTRMFLRT